VLSGGERNEQIALEAVLDQGAVRRPGRGRPVCVRARLATKPTAARPHAPVCVGATSGR